jgi:preprotein translocase subunit SecF
MNYKKILLIPIIIFVISLAYIVYQTLTGLFVTDISLSQISYVFISSLMLVTILNYLIFRKPISSLSIFLCLFADIIETLVFSQLLGIAFSLTAFATLFLVIGYSIGNNTFLNYRILKLKSNEKDIIKTWLMINGITIIVLALLMLASFSIITMIAPLFILGLLFDAINIFLSLGILKIVLEREIK